MKPSTFLRIAVLVAGAAASSAVLLACSSDDSANAGPVVYDSGVSNQPDSTVAPTPEAGPITQPEASAIDANLPDVGSCVSDASTCNSCYTPQQNPLNGCSPASVNCVPFDNTRVPTGAP